MHGALVGGPAQAVEARRRGRPGGEPDAGHITIQNYFRMYDKLAGMTGTRRPRRPSSSRSTGSRSCDPTNGRCAGWTSTTSSTRRAARSTRRSSTRSSDSTSAPAISSHGERGRLRDAVAHAQATRFPHEVLNASTTAEPRSCAAASRLHHDRDNMRPRNDIKLGPGEEVSVCGSRRTSPVRQQIERPTSH